MSDSIEFLHSQAQLYARTGPVEAAVEAYQRLLAAEPKLPDCWYNLGHVLNMAGRHEEALQAYAEALVQGAENPEQIHLNRAAILSDSLRDDARAEEELNLALAINPDYLPALMNYGNLHEDRGDREAARKAYVQVLARKPWFFWALARYAGVHDPSGPNDPVILRLRQALAMPDPDLLERATLGFALGRLLDLAGAYDEAFAVVRQANEDDRAAVRRQGLPADYDPAAQEALIDGLIAAFTPERMAQLQATAPDAQGPEPVFVCGMFRSGSTLCEQVLASHPDVTMGGELAILPNLAAKTVPGYPHSAEALDADAVAMLRTGYRAELAKLFPMARYVTDKRTENFLHIGLIKAMFPRAKIVHTRRAPLDNALSVYFLQLDHRVLYAGRLEDIGHFYRQQERLMAHWHALFGDSIFEFGYDQFVRDQRGVTERLLAACGLPWDPACLDFHTAKTSVKTASVWQVRQPLYGHASGRAAHYAAHLGPLRAALGEGA